MANVSDKWVDWDGNGTPASPETMVIVRFRDGVEETEDDPSRVDYWNWEHFDTGLDIVAYRVIE